MKFDKSFLAGSLSTLLIVVIILLSFWIGFAQPWLNGVSYNMQLDESIERALGINPTSDYQSMWHQVEVIRAGQHSQANHPEWPQP
jgi:hypothetical protein